MGIIWQNTTKDLCTPKLCTLVSSMQTLLNDWLKHANDGLFINSVEFSKWCKQNKTVIDTCM